MKSPYMAILIYFAIIISVHAEVYKWTDEQGNVHYSDKSVKNSEQMNISDEVSGKDPEMDDRADQRRKLIDAMEEDRKEKEKAKEEEQKRVKALKRKCQWARDELHGYETAGSVYHLDKEGNRVHLSDKERKKFTGKLRSQIQKFCK